jgi:hypothetical protein
MTGPYKGCGMAYGPAWPVRFLPATPGRLTGLSSATIVLCGSTYMHFFLVPDEMDLYNDRHFLDASMPEGLRERGSSD